MTRTIQYTHNFEPNSSVVQEVFFDFERQELYVKLHSGVVAGYHGVPKYVYNEFRSASSAGQYWNWNIKRNYGTVNGDVNFIPFEKPSSVSVNTSSFNPAPGNKNFTVIVRVEGDLKFDLDAEDIVSATKRVYELVEKSVVDGVYFVKEVKVNDKGN